MKNKIAAVDFDGVLCADSADIYADFAAGRYQPMQAGAVEGLAWLRKNGYEIVIYTCRPYEQRGYLQEFLRTHRLEHDYIVFHGKPRAEVYIDDKALRFTTWPEAVEQLAALTPQAFAQEPNTLFEESLKRERWRELKLGTARRVLDVGAGQAPHWPEALATVDVVEPDESARLQLRRNPRLGRMFGTLEEVGDLSGYDLVTVFGVLEHVASPAEFLRPLLWTARRIFLTVPNANSFHRLVGVQMGLLKSTTELSAADHAIGHRRYYTADEWHQQFDQFKNSGFRGRFGSSGFKVGNNQQMAGLLGAATGINDVARDSGLIGRDSYQGAELFAELWRS